MFWNIGKQLTCLLSDIIGQEASRRLGKCSQRVQVPLTARLEDGRPLFVCCICCAVMRDSLLVETRLSWLLHALSLFLSGFCRRLPPFFGFSEAPLFLAVEAGRGTFMAAPNKYQTLLTIVLTSLLCPVLSRIRSCLSLPRVSVSGWTHSLFKSQAGSLILILCTV